MVFHWRFFANHVTLELPTLFIPTTIDFMQAALVVAIPQIPLTIGNAILATSLLCHDYFPKKQKISVKRLSLSHGVMNLIAVLLGGIPVCHGAGGLASHHRFGARTGGALVIIGVFMLLLGLFYGNAILKILSLFPFSILGVLLFFSGFELTMTVKDVALNKRDLCCVVCCWSFNSNQVRLSYRPHRRRCTRALDKKNVSRQQAPVATKLTQRF